MKKLLLLTALLTSCYRGRYPVTPSVAESSTYKIFNEDAMGTAWAIDRHHVVTAGHVCEQLDHEKFMLVSSTERRIPAVMVESEMSKTNGLADLCVLETRAEVGEGLIIADRMPKVGDKVGYVGYPNGIHYVGEGKYEGDVDGPDEHYNDDATSAPCDHGASGSAMFTSRGVFGVLVRLRTDGGYVHPGEEGCVVIPLKELKSFLKDAGVKYETTPGEPDDDDVFTKNQLGG